jgi:hypothetical protein
VRLLIIAASAALSSLVVQHRETRPKDAQDRPKRDDKPAVSFAKQFNPKGSKRQARREFARRRK